MSERRIPSLDGLRAISITLVILSHLVQWKHVTLEVIGSYGSLGVFVFFVLSGYLITNLLQREHGRTCSISLRMFYVRRAFRIFPAAFVFLAVVLLLYWRQMQWYHVVAAAFYVANMDLSRPWIFGHLWSLSIEEQFYLLWPFALKKWYRHRTAIVLCAFWATPFFRTALYVWKVHNGLVGSLPIYSSQLAIGCLLAILAPRLPRISGPIALVMLAGFIAAPWFVATSRARTLLELFVLSPALHIAVAGLVLHIIQRPYRFLNWAPVAWLGRISYSLYLWQELFCSNPTLHAGYLLVLPSVACACLSYYLIERPMLLLRDNWTRKPSPPRQVLAPAENVPVASLIAD